MKKLDDSIGVEQRYAELLDAAPQASVYQTLDWLRVFKTLGCELLFVELDGDGLIPFVCKGRGVLKRAFSLPYDTYGGPVGSNGKSVSYDEVVRTLGVRSARLVDFSAGVGPTRCNVETMKTHLVALDSGYESVVRRYSSMNRRALRQSKKRGLEIAVLDSGEQIAAFYRLYRRTVLKYRTPPLPRRFFESVFSFMVPKGLARFYLAWFGGDPVAGNLVLRYKGKAYDWTWGYDPEYLHLRPTNALIDRAIRDEISAGTTVFNLGTSPASSNGNARFKENFGAADYTYRVFSQAGFCYQAARMIKNRGIRLRASLR